MLNGTQSINENTVAITPEKLEEIKSCIRSKEGIQQSLLGTIMGVAVASLPLVFAKSKAVKRKALAFFFVGGLYGYVASKYFRVKNCIAKVLNDPYVEEHSNNIHLMQKDMLDVNIYEKGKNKLGSEEFAKAEVLPPSSKESIFDVESSPRMSLLDEFPAINESADVPDNKEPERTVTYKELRERNREGYKSRNFVQKPTWSRDQSKEQSVQTKEFETEFKESDLFPEQSAGKRKTKYGDVWD